MQLSNILGFAQPPRLCWSTASAKVEGSVAVVQEDMSEIRPVTDDAKRWKRMGVGALAVIGVGAMAMGVPFAYSIRRMGRSFC